LDQLDPGLATYNIAVALRLTGALDLAALAGSLAAIVRRHESLRTTFVEVAGEPRQVVSAAAGLALPLVDLEALAGRALADAEAVARQEAARPFALRCGPLLRVGALRLAAREHVVTVTMHHIVSDGWSLGLFVREVVALYAAALAGRPSPLPALAAQYPDFA